MKETIKNGNGIDKDYCKYIMECEKEREKQKKLLQELKKLSQILNSLAFFNV